MQKFEKPLLTVEELSAALYNANEQLRLLNRELTETNDKLLVMDRNRTEMFSNISHDLRSPITAIKSSIEYLLSDSCLSRDEINKNLKLMDVRVNTLETLINDIFLLATLESESLKLQFETLDIVPVLEEFYYEYELDPKFHGRKLSFETGEVSPVYVSIDVKYLLRVLDNLYSNALKYSNDGDSITLILSKKQEKVMITVKDTGIGIHPQDAGRIFERSYMVDRARTPDSKQGFGLGLSICKEIIELHHGSISCTGTYGRGSSFTITLSTSCAEEDHYENH